MQNLTPENQILVKCPACGATNSCCPIIRLTPGSPHVKELNCGRLNRICCQQCKTHFLLDVPIIYRDDQHQALIYYSDTSETPEPHILEYLDTLTNESNYDVRLTRNRRRFIEKIAIMRDDLDDRLMEFIKYQLHQVKGENSIDPIRYELFYDFSCADVDKIAFLVFDRETGKATAATHLQREIYEELEEQFSENLGWREEIISLFDRYEVSVDLLF